MSGGASFAGAAVISFEFFPPKTEAMEARLWQAIEALASLRPRFVSVTYGAGGSTRQRTHNTVIRLRRETDLEPAAHLTCVGATCGEVDDIARGYWQEGIRHIVALRGDPPEAGRAYIPYPGGYAYAADLVAGLRRVADFEISVAAYPEGHPEAASPAADLDALKRKIDAGACRAISQFFFEPQVFFRFLEKARKAGITVPIIPGILPIGNLDQVRSFAVRCGARVPEAVGERFTAGLADCADEAAARQAATRIGTDLAIELCAALGEGGVDGFHFYTLNRADMVWEIVTALGLGQSGEQPGERSARIF